MIKENGLLSERRWQVYDVLYQNGPLTANQLVQMFIKKYPHYRLTNTGSLATRLSELRDCDVVQEIAEIRCPVSSYMAILWDVTTNLPMKKEKKKKIKCDHCNGNGYVEIIDSDKGYWRGHISWLSSRTAEKLPAQLSYKNDLIADDWEIQQLPKRKVTKTVRGWVNLYLMEEGHFYYTREHADKNASNFRLACVEMTGSHEVEE